MPARGQYQWECVRVEDPKQGEMQQLCSLAEMLCNHYSDEIFPAKWNDRNYISVKYVYGYESLSPQHLCSLCDGGNKI